MSAMWVSPPFPVPSLAVLSCAVLCCVWWMWIRDILVAGPLSRLEDVGYQINHYKASVTPLTGIPLLA